LGFLKKANATNPPALALNEISVCKKFAEVK
jgi:hypothetical protein